MDEREVEYLLTTVDNPYNPFTEYDAWSAFDMSHGYNTPQLLASVTFVSDDLSEADQASAIQSGIEEVAEINASGMHRKVARTDFEAA